MKKYFNLFIALFAFVLLANCDRNEVEIDIPKSAVNKVEIKTISIDEFSNDASNFSIYEAISNHIEKPEDIRKKGGSKKITILTDEIKVLNKNEVLTYTFRIEEPTSKSSLFENLIIHKFPNGTFQFAITKFKKGKNNSKFPYKIEYKKVKQNKIDNLDELNVILKSQQQPCYEPVFYLCSENDAGLHDSEEVWTNGIYLGMCGGTDMGFEQVDCETLEPLSGGSNTGDSWGGFGDSNEPGDNSGNNDGGNNHTPSGYNPSGPILTPPCGDPVHGCDKVANNIAIQLGLNTDQRNWLRGQDDETILKFITFLDLNVNSQGIHDIAEAAIDFLIHGIEIDNGISNFVDEEPVKIYLGTISDFKNLLDNSPRQVGKFTGTNAHDYLKSLGETKFNWKQMRPLPTQTGFFNTKKGRYIYTKKGGWIDMAHFMFYAGKAYKYKLDGYSNPIGEAVQDGYYQEASDSWVAAHSAYSYEDLPSDKFGAEFAVNYFNSNSNLSFSSQLFIYFIDVLEASIPSDAPNFNSIPDNDSRSAPTQTNETTIPLYTK